MIEYPRSAFATLLVLLPGWLVARAAGPASASATVAWAFACPSSRRQSSSRVHGSIRLAVGVLAATEVRHGSS
jgi:hypothetical protein